jgi:hypothetical protein
MYDWLTCKLFEILINVFHTFSHVQVGNVTTSSQSELVVITNEEPKQVRRGSKLAIISYTLPLPIEPMEVHVVVVNSQV